MREILHISAGQAGNQVGAKFCECAGHAAAVDGLCRTGFVPNLDWICFPMED